MVDAHPGEMIDVARFGQANDRVDQDVCLASSRSADGQFSMGSVHGVASLKGNDPRPAELFEMDSELRWSIAQLDIIVVVESRDGVDLTAYVIILDGVVQVLDCWMLWVSTEYFFGLLSSEPCQKHAAKGISLTDLSGLYTSSMVMIARFRSSRKSLSVIRSPAFRPAFSTVFSETSKHIGMLKRLPSAMRTFSTTLTFC